jgi:hypothetical protein
MAMHSTTRASTFVQDMVPDKVHLLDDGGGAEAPNGRLAPPVTGAAVKGDVGSGTCEPCHQPACAQGGGGRGPHNRHFCQLQARSFSTCHGKDHRCKDSQQRCRRGPVSPCPDSSPAHLEGPFFLRPFHHMREGKEDGKDGEANSTPDGEFVPAHARLALSSKTGS